MLKHRHMDRIALTATVLAVVIVLLFLHGESLGIRRMHSEPDYARKLFDETKVHSVDLVVSESDWERILKHPEQKEYIPAVIVIDGEKISNAGVRIKGSNSLTQIKKYGSDRFSMKVEFDHYEAGKTFGGLDKLSLNASFQDNTYLKETMAYDMMRRLGVPAPLTGYAYLTVNGKDRGLFVAVEEIEEAFIRRNYGSNLGTLYKPEYKKLTEENADVALIYTGDESGRYDNIFRKARFGCSDADKARLIASLRKLSLGEDLENTVDVETALRLFVVQNFVVNLDSYLGSTGHNYYLREAGGRLTMLPWDFNLAFGTYLLGMPDPIRDPTYAVNLPIDTPSKSDILSRRPLYHNLMIVKQYRDRYHEIYDEFLKIYMESGYFEERVQMLREMISPYVKKDPTKFASYEDFLHALEVFRTFNQLRAQSVRGQLEGSIPSSLREMGKQLDSRIDASMIRIEDLGDFEDMKRLINGRLPQ